MKRQLEGSFLFASAELFYPNGVPEDAAELPDLGPAEISRLQSQVASILETFIQFHRKVRASLADQLGRPVGAGADVRVSLISTGQPVARIRRNGEIALDAKVLQAMFRAALVSAFQAEIMLAQIEDGELHGEASWTDADSQRLAVREMLALKRRVEEMEGRSVIREVTARDPDLRSADEGGTGWFAMHDLAKVSQTAQRSYAVQELFLLGHELGHAVLGHHDADLAGLGCEDLRGFEAEADAYAALMLALATPGDAVQDMLGLFGSSLGLGLDDLFDHAYEFAGFEAATVSARCPPPEAEERGRRVREVYDAVRSEQLDELLQEAERE